MGGALAGRMTHMLRFRVSIHARRERALRPYPRSSCYLHRGREDIPLLLLQDADDAEGVAAGAQAKAERFAVSVADKFAYLIEFSGGHFAAPVGVLR